MVPRTFKIGNNKHKVTKDNHNILEVLKLLLFYIVKYQRRIRGPGERDFEAGVMGVEWDLTAPPRKLALYAIFGD